MKNKKIFSNALWMISEKSVNIIGLIFINAYMAKYVGPDNFGKIAFATSIFLLVQSFSWFGGQNILFKRMSERDNTGFNLAEATQLLRTILLIISSSLALLYLSIYSDRLTFIFGVANFIASYFIVSDIFAIYNNSKLQSHINTTTNVIGLLIALLIRYVIVRLAMPIEWLVIPIIVIPMVPYLLRIYIFRKKNKARRVYLKRKPYNKYLYKTGGALLLSSMSIVLYTQISNIILAKYVSYEDLGIYTIAMTLGSAWVFIPQALITSYFSKIYAKNKEEEVNHLLNSMNFLVISISIFCFLFFYFFGAITVSKLYGDEYVKAYEIIPFIVIGTMFSALGTIAYRYMIKLGGYQYLTIKMFLIACLSIPIAFVFINNFKLMGAVYSFVTVEILSATIANYFFKKGEILHVQTAFILKRK